MVVVRTALVLIDRHATLVQHLVLHVAGESFALLDHLADVVGPVRAALALQTAIFFIWIDHLAERVLLTLVLTVLWKAEKV